MRYVLRCGADFIYSIYGGRASAACCLRSICTRNVYIFKKHTHIFVATAVKLDMLPQSALVCTIYVFVSCAYSPRDSVYVPRLGCGCVVRDMRRWVGRICARWCGSVGVMGNAQQRYKVPTRHLTPIEPLGALVELIHVFRVVREADTDSYCSSATTATRTRPQVASFLLGPCSCGEREKKTQRI